MTTPKTAQQINDPQTGQAITSRHSALSELMIQNAELREQLRVLQSAYDSLSKMKEKSVASRIETEELKEENANMKSDLALWAKYFDKQWPKDVHETIERLKAENARLAAENRRLGYAPSLMLLYLNQMAERFVKQEGHIGPRDAAVYEQGIGMERAWKELREKFAPFECLNNLLAPTIELLLKIRPTAQYQCFHAIVEDLDKELDRLRGLVEGKP